MNEEELKEAVKKGIREYEVEKIRIKKEADKKKKKKKLYIFGIMVIILSILGVICFCNRCLEKLF